VAGRPIKPRTRAHYQALLDDHLLPAFGNRQLGAITPKHVRDWHADTLTNRPTMRAHAYSLLRTILASAVELRRGDVDLGAEVIRVRRAAVRVKQDIADEQSPRYAYQVGTPKSDASIRDVTIPPHLVPVIEEHLTKHVGAARDALLFPAVGGRGHLQPATLARHWYKARASINRDDLRWHDLRHSGAVLAAATGASLAELMARLGHSTPQAAMRYQHAAAGRDREIAGLLSKLAENG